MLLLHILDVLVFLLFLINILYLLFFSIASRCGKKEKNGSSAAGSNPKRIAVLIPAYKEDAVIMECVEACLEQNYPQDRYDVVVISDRMQKSTDEALRNKKIRLIPVRFENSTKAKALNYAMAQLDDAYDLALVLDADNTIKPDFLHRLDAAFGREGTAIVQAHRCAKNSNTNLALLDAVSEEINNSIFRLGHANAGLSAALIGSGMCFDYALFKGTMASIDAVGGFDRALELTLLREGYRIGYLEDARVLDEKVQRHRDFSRQRRRWLSAQIHYLLAFARELPGAVRARNWDFCDKMFQQMSCPRIMLLGFCTIIAIALSFVDMRYAVKWWIALLLLVSALVIAIPKYLFNRKLLVAVILLPYSFLLMTLNVFRLRGANKRFIHTSHGVNS